MSKTWWSGGAVSLLGLFLTVAYLADWQRIWLSWIFGIGILVCVVMAVSTKTSKKDAPSVTAKVSGQDISGNVVAAGRDGIQTVHYYHPDNTQPFGMRVDAAALRDFKKHRDEGEKLLQSVRAGDGKSGTEWAKRDEWWTNAIAKANQNVFERFLTLKDLKTLTEPWPEVDKLPAVARAVDAGQINNNDDDVNLYLTHWERLERVRQLIGIIESRG